MSPAARESMARRWARLKPHATVTGPPGRRPVVLLFHGCGGLSGQLEHYAAVAAGVGARAVIVDSYASRGWHKSFATAAVCSGALLRGAERAGDVLAAAFGAVQDLDADPEQLVLAGWSHGAWSIMDLMTMPLTGPGEAGLADGSPAPLAGLKGLYLAYPYGGIGALSRTRDWVRAPATLAVVALKDHITSVRDSERVFDAPRRAGAELNLWRAPARHAFDEPGLAMSPIQYDSALAAEALERFSALLQGVLASPV